MPDIDVEFVYRYVDKYIDSFAKRFPTTVMEVHFTPTGQPPVPPEFRDSLMTSPVSGLFIKVSNKHVIGINNQLMLPAQLSTFFHEYGHAAYRCTSGEEITDEESLTRTETAAMLSSLRLPDREGLPEIATVSVFMIREAAKFGGTHQKAFVNIATDPLWLKYANSTQS
jgi:hypothetical protein